MRLSPDMFLDEDASTAVVDEPAVEETADVSTPDDPGVEAPVEAPVEDLPQSTLLDRIRDEYELDLSGKYGSDEEALKGMVHAVRKIGERDELAEIGKQFRQHEPQFQQWLQSQQQPTQEPEPQQGWWAPPEVDETWNKYLRRDEAGNVVFDENTPIAVRQKLEELQNYHANWAHRLTTNPMEALKPALEEVEQRAFERAVQHFSNQQTAQQSQARAAQIVEANSEWIFQKSTGGNVIRDAVGNPVLSPMGQAYVEEVHRLTQAGMYDPVEIDRVAQLAARAQVAPAKKKPATAPVTKEENRPAASPERAASRSQAGQQGRSLREKLLATAEEADGPEYVE